MHVNMLEAKTQLSRLVEAVLRGEEVVIANRGKPVVKLVPVDPSPAVRQLGSLAGTWTDAEIDAAFSPHADAEAAADLWSNLQRRELRVMQPSTVYKVQPLAKAAAAAAKTAQTKKKPRAKAGPAQKPASGRP